MDYFMRPLTVYRHAVARGLQIELDETGRGLIVYGPQPELEKRMALIKRNRLALVELLNVANDAAAKAIRSAMQTSRPTRRYRQKTTESRGKAIR